MVIILKYISFIAIIIGFWLVIIRHIRDNDSTPSSPDKSANSIYSIISYWLCFFSFFFLLISFLLDRFNNLLGIEFKVLSFSLLMLSIFNFLGVKAILDFKIRHRSNQSY